MGKPMSNDEKTEMLAGFLREALGPGGSISIRKLREAGLDRDILLQFFVRFKPAIADLVGWRKLSSFYYSGSYRPEYGEPIYGERLTVRWQERLKAAELSDQMAIQIFDGEAERAPAPDYRLFLLRDGRLLHYAGGFYPQEYTPAITCGDILDVYAALPRSNHVSSPMLVDPALIIMQALATAVMNAIKYREQKAKSQREFHSDLMQRIQLLSHK